jgi:diguanylate cyclase (GGDEF)-like protein/PAS domain S-box-containing protein
MSCFVAVRYTWNVNLTKILVQDASEEVGRRVASSVKISIWDIYLKAYDRHYSVDFASSILDAEMQSSFVRGIKVFGIFEHLYTGKIKQGDSIELYVADRHDKVWEASEQKLRFPIVHERMTIGYIEVLYSDQGFSKNIQTNLLVDITQVAIISLLFIFILYIVLRKTLVSPLQSWEVAHRALSSLKEAVFVLDKAGVIIDTNPSYLKMIKSASITDENHTPPLYAQEYPDYTVLDLIEKHDLQSWEGEVVVARREGDDFPGLLNLHKVISKGKLVTYVGVLNDITEEKAAQKKLQHLAYKDTLTKVYNRHAFMQDLENQLQKAALEESNIALLYIDLDKFKWVNDSFGHHVGDQLLVALCQRFSEQLRQTDVLYRVGGDEFTIIVKDFYDSNALVILAQKLIDIAAQIFLLDNLQIHTGVSIGISTYPEDAQTAQALIKHSDAAMFQAKSQGRGEMCFFSSKLDRHRKREQKIIQELEQAVKAGEFELYIQPKISLNGKYFSSNSVEALIRWKRNGKIVCAPDIFIPIAEQNNLICAIGYWVIEQACILLMKWREEEKKSISIAVNLSPKQLQDSKLYSYLKASLERYQIKAGELEIEITESAVIEDIEGSIATLQQIRSLGIVIAMDDFGTGYSSLGYLKQLPIDILKIDRSFINSVPDDVDDVAIVLAIFSMANALGIGVVAEGVETLEQLDFLVESGCEIVQGFYFSEPLSIEEFNRWLLDFTR